MIALLAWLLIGVTQAAYLPEEKMTSPELIRYWGYPVETHETTTRDGYILTLHRIPHGRGKGEKERAMNQTRPVMFLQHPLTSSSAEWLINLPHQSLGYVLADKGYDVWLGNVRGNHYSKKHVSLDLKSKAFWDFTFQDHASLDLPAMLDYILNKTKQKQVYYMGHSQGTTMAFAGLSESENLQSKIKIYFALAPAARIAHTNEAFRGMASKLGYFQLYRKLFNVNEIFPLQNALDSAKLCRFIPNTCEALLEILTGPDAEGFNVTRVPIYISHTPAGTSSKNVAHWFQLIQSKSFAKYDYGERGNFEHYNSRFPPEYDLRKIKVPTVLVSGSADTLAPAEDVAWAKDRLPNVKHVEVKGFNHLDFLHGVKGGEVVAKIVAENV